MKLLKLREKSYHWGASHLYINVCRVTRTNIEVCVKHLCGSNQGEWWCKMQGIVWPCNEVIPERHILFFVTAPKSVYHQRGRTMNLVIHKVDPFPQNAPIDG